MILNSRLTGPRLQSRGRGSIEDRTKFHGVTAEPDCTQFGPGLAKKATKGKVKKEETEQDRKVENDKEEYRWWEDPTKGDGTKKWFTLEHNGLVFPPPYKSPPNEVRMRFDEIPVTMALEAEEVAGFLLSGFLEVAQRDRRQRHRWKQRKDI